MEQQISDIGYQISDINGKTIIGMRDAGRGIFKIDISGMPAGIYFLTIEGEGFREVKMVLVR